MQRSVGIFSFVSAILIVASGCGEDPGGGGGSARAADIQALDGDAVAGGALYDDNSVSSCATCHGAAGAGGSGGRVAGASVGKVVDEMLSGPDDMPTYDTLDDQELADIAAYVAAL